MFCPKCGIENPDDGRFCRSCGANLSNVLAAVEGNLSAENIVSFDDTLAELRGTSIRNIILGFGFLAAAGLLFTIPPREGLFWLLLMITGFCLLASGISRWIKADTLKNERKNKIKIIPQSAFPANQPIKELPPTQNDYIKPQNSIYKTDELASEPLSVTEETTRHLEMQTESETMTLPQKMQ